MARHHSHSSSHSSRLNNLTWAFFVNLGFAVIEFFGGILTHSLSVQADAVHDLGDSLSLLLAITLERFALKNKTEKFSYGYRRLSLFSALIAGSVIFASSSFIIFKSVNSLLSDQKEVHTLGMMGLAILGVIVNSVMVMRLKKGHSASEKIITWHFIEDCLGWIAVLIGAMIIRFTGWTAIDAILGILLALFVVWNVTRNLNSVVQVLLQGRPLGFDEGEFKNKVMSLPGVIGVHDIHAWSLDGIEHILSFHLQVKDSVSGAGLADLKKQCRQIVGTIGKFHATIETESEVSNCPDNCRAD